MYKLLKKAGKVRRGEFITPHGVIQTPVFMNVGTLAAIKGAVSSMDLKEIGCQVELSNTYHLSLRPGDKVVKQLGGLHEFMNWDRPILTDSGGFQVFSLSSIRKIKEEGVYFNSHIDGRKIFMGPEESMQIQSNLASTIAMAFDECIPNPSPREYVEASVARTTRWLERSKNELDRLNSLDSTINKKQMLFGINQGGVYDDIRIEHAKTIAKMNLDGYAIGGLAVGETHEEMYRVIDAVVPHLPQDKPIYLMGVGLPSNILEAVSRGVDFFDCVLPARNGRHGHVFTKNGKINLFNAKYETDASPIDDGCQCPTCRNYSKAYIRHLFKAKEMLAMRLCVLHNLYFYNKLMEDIRNAIDGDYFEEFKTQKIRNVEWQSITKLKGGNVDMNSTVVSVVYVLIIIGFFFVVVFLPEKKRKKRFSQMMEGLRVNDEVVTRGGIVGKVINIQDDFVIIQSGPDKSRIKILKAAVDRILNKQIEEKK